MGRNSNSPAWLCFDKVDSKAQCKFCDTAFALAGGSTGNMMKHLRQNHNEEFKAITSNQIPHDVGVFDMDHARNLLARSFASGNIPFRYCQNKDFRAFCQYLNSKFTNVTDDKIKSILLNNAECYWEKLKSELKEKKNLTICADGWKAPSDIGTLYVLYLFYVDENYERKQHLLGVSRVEESSTAANIGSTLIKILKKVDLSLADVCCSCTDGAANMLAMASQNQLLIVKCSCHTVQLVFQELCSSSKLEVIVCKARTVARLLKKSPLEKELFIKKAQMLKISSPIPRNFASTRWAGAFILLRAFSIHTRTLGCSEQLQKFMPTHKESKLLGSFLNVGQILHGSLLKLEKENSFVSDILPQLQLTINELKELNTPLSKHTAKIVQERSQFYEECDNVLMTNLTDPRIAYVPGFSGPGSWEAVEDKIMKYSDELNIVDASAVSETKEINKEQLSSMDKLIQSKLIVDPKSDKECVKLKDELRTYRANLLTNRPPSSTNPLSYWQINRTALPNLASLAKVFLSSPASSACSERIFSSCSDIARNTKRNRLKESTFNAILLNLALSRNNRWSPNFDRESTDDEIDDDEDEEYDAEYNNLNRKRKALSERGENGPTEFEDGHSKKKKEKKDEEKCLDDGIPLENRVIDDSSATLINEDNKMAENSISSKPIRESENYTDERENKNAIENVEPSNKNDSETEKEVTSGHCEDGKEMQDQEECTRPRGIEMQDQEESSSENGDSDEY